MQNAEHEFQRKFKKGNHSKNKFNYHMAHINEKYICFQSVADKKNPFITQVNYTDGEIGQYHSRNYKKAKSFEGKMIAIFKPKCKNNKKLF